MTRERIIERFMQRVNGRQPDIAGGNPEHDGGAGHWFERLMGIRPNADNRPDLWGFECKNATGSQTTFGDWKADYLIWRDPERFPNLEGLTGGMRRANSPFRIQQLRNKDEVFLPAFGTWRDATENVCYELDGEQVFWENNGFFSWSGICPQRVTQGYRNEGQALLVNEDNSISVVYSYSHDSRDDKDQSVPENFRIENLTLIRWSEEKITEFVENKFGQRGWFKALMDRQRRYNALIFGGPIHIDEFLQAVRNGDIKFDPRMKQRRPDGSDRFGMQWRARNSFWINLSDERFDPPQV